MNVKNCQSKKQHLDYVRTLPNLIIFLYNQIQSEHKFAQNYLIYRLYLIFILVYMCCR